MGRNVMIVFEIMTSAYILYLFFIRFKNRKVSWFLVVQGYAMFGLMYVAFIITNTAVDSRPLQGFILGAVTFTSVKLIMYKLFKKEFYDFTDAAVVGLIGLVKGEDYMLIFLLGVLVFSSMAAVVKLFLQKQRKQEDRQIKGDMFKFLAPSVFLISTVVFYISNFYY